MQQKVKAMKGKLTVLVPNKRQETVELDVAVKLQLLCDIVGGNIEQVPYWSTYEGEPCVVFCDDEGKVKKLPVNKEATEEWHYARVREGVKRVADKELRGPVVIVTGDKDFMEMV
jgi:hypothetical protein